jgi:hypothetical protein
VKTIALTGEPRAQDAAVLYLQAAINGRALPLQILAGLTERTEAYRVRDEGGEIWQCGPEAPRRDLVGYIDRVLPADSVLTIGEQVNQCLDEFLAKVPLN